MYHKEKDKINILMNIDSYFGEHQGRLAPMLMFMGISAAPFIFYVIFLIPFIPLKWILIFEVPFTIRMALKILGNEKEKLKTYIKEKEDEFATADDLVRVTHVHEDGLIEYTNDMVAYIISAYPTTYFDDNEFSIDFEEFIKRLRGFEYDIDCQQVVNEFKLQDNLEGMKAYTDRELMQERMEFYIEQDAYCEKNTELYRFVITVKTSKYNWKKLKSTLEAVCKSSYAKVFYQIKVCNRDEVSSIMSRDLCLYVDLAEMLQNKYSNSNYYGSKVLFYGEEIPEELQQKKDKVNMLGRRVIEK